VVKLLQWADHARLVLPGDMGIDHRCLYVRVPEQFLDGSDIVTGLDQMGCKTVSQRMNSCPLAHFQV